MPRPAGSVELPQAVRDIIDRIVEGYDPDKIIIFGSYARGDASPDSDLDVLVIKDTDDRWIDRVVEVSSLCRPRLLPMDILVRTPAEVEELLKDRSLFMRTVIEEGVAAYDRESA